MPGYWQIPPAILFSHLAGAANPAWGSAGCWCWYSHGCHVGQAWEDCSWAGQGDFFWTQSPSAELPVAVPRWEAKQLWEPQLVGTSLHAEQPQGEQGKELIFRQPTATSLQCYLCHFAGCARARDPSLGYVQTL